jgi:hypothetical protein
MVLMFGMFGMILFGANAASTLQAERIKEANRKKRTKKKQTAGRKKQGRGHGHSTLMGESTHSVKKQGRSTKTAKTRPLSEFENRILAGYFVGRDYPIA